MADKIAKLKSIANLRDTGILSEREFEAAKAKILSEPSPAKKGIGNTGGMIQAPSKTNQNPRSPIRPCAICKKEFTWTTLAKYGGNVCGRCFKSKCRCKICDVENTIDKMWDVNSTSHGPLCGTCYIPTALSYLTYLFAFIYILTFGWFLALVFVSVFVIGFWALEGLKTFSKVHNYTIRPTNIRKSSIFIIVLALMLCSILALTLASPWFVYTVTYDHAYNKNPEWADYQGEAFTHEYYLDYVEVDIKHPDRWMDDYQQANEYYNDSWYYSTTSYSFEINYDRYDFEHRQYVSSTTQILGFISIVGYALSVVTGFIFYRMTTKLEPNFLYLKRREKFQSQVNSFAKKFANMKKKGIVVSSLNPYLNELEKIYTSKVDDVIVNNPLKILNLVIVCAVVGVSFSTFAVFFYAQNWYGALQDDGVNGIASIYFGSWSLPNYPYHYYGNYHISPIVILLSFSIAVGLILTVSHAIFLRRSCYNMVAEIIDSSSRTSDFEIPSELLIDAEEPLTTTELPDPGEEILAEVVKAEPESGKDET
jgi:hypothetical protein